MMGSPDAGRYVSRRFLRDLAAWWFLVGVVLGALVTSGAFSFLSEG